MAPTILTFRNRNSLREINDGKIFIAIDHLPDSFPLWGGVASSHFVGCRADDRQGSVD
jgi:hypothetical protein